jgi:hypothetical protein
MKALIRVALTVISLATITPVANAADTTNSPAPVAQDSMSNWANG